MPRLDRRSLFTSATAAALLAASGLSADAAPKRGGRLRLAVPRDGTLLHLLKGGVCDSLTEIAPDGTLRGNLATEWKPGPDGEGWTFTLTRAQFHDGTPLSAARVAASLNDAGIMARAAGPRSVTVTARPADPGLPLRMAETGFAIHAGARGPLVGTGPYRIERFETDRNFLLRRSENSHRTGWADEVEAIVVPDADVRTQALLEGHVDIAIRPALETLPGNPALRIVESVTTPAIAVAAHVGLPPRIGAGAFDNGRLIERWWLA